MVEKLEENIYRIGVPLPGNPLRELNSYFIRGEDSDLLIDTGFRRAACREALEAGLEELGSDPRRRDVLVTHLHSDHSGMADLFVGEGRRIYMSQPDLDYLAERIRVRFSDPKNDRFEREGFPRGILEEIDRVNPAKQEALSAITDAFMPLRDGEKLRVGKYELELIIVPGHTPGNSMLWIEKEGIMFSGDHVLFDITPNITEWPGVEDALGDYLDSLERVRDYPVRRTLPGHRAEGEYRARIDYLLAHHQKRLTEALEVVRTNPGLTAYEIAGKMTWKIRADSWEEFPIIQKWFAVGECLSHLDYLRKRGKVGREQREGLWRYEAM